MKYILMLSLVFAPYLLSAQIIKGVVFDSEGPLIGANIYTEDKVYGTVTDAQGAFALELPEAERHSLVFSYVGYANQIVDLDHDRNFDDEPLRIQLEPELIDEVQIVAKTDGRSLLNPMNVELLDARELTKAACCNLSESFETSVTVDVNFTDAVSGAKKIRMLGIDGHYVQTNFENMPSIRGLGNAYGMLFVPGPFMQGISINKGSGSVVNGYEAITGQINYDYKKPCGSERFFLNLFGSRHGQFEMNTNFSHRFNDNVAGMALIHGMIHESVHDENNDGFQDVPLNERIVAMTRWRLDKGDVFRSQLMFNYVFDDRQSGQLPNFFIEVMRPEQLYDIETVTRKYDLSAKTGFLFRNLLQSIGITYRYTHHEQDSWYGNRVYQGREDYANVNFTFQTAMNTSAQTMKVGWSYTFDDFEESFDSDSLTRRESVPGVFGEYTYQDNEKIAFVAGLRADFHNMHGFWLSPRVHFKYNLKKDLVVKLSAGKGYRTANIFAENMGALASSREWVIADDLGYESAWNAGIGLFKDFYLGFQQGSIAIDYYRTDFTDQVVVDMEDPASIRFYQLDGSSYSNSFQVEAEVEAFKGFDVKLAYKLDDVHTNYESGLKRNPYIPLHKALLTLNYETPNKAWRFDVTGKFTGRSRVPSTLGNDILNVRPERSPGFFTLHSQITAVVKKWEFYIGGENLTNYWQQNPIIDSFDPFGNEFDASMIWGPIGGVRLYGGLRFTLPYKEGTFNEKL